MDLKKKLKPIREKIDNIDNKIFQLLVERKKVTDQVGPIKEKINSPIYMADRESLIAYNLYEKSKDNNLNPILITRIWREIIASTLLNEGKYEVATLKNNPELMAISRSHFGDCAQIKTYQTNKQLIKSLIDDTQTIIVLNTTDKNIQHIYENNLYIVGFLPFSYTMEEFNNVKALIVSKQQKYGFDGNYNICILDNHKQIKEKHKILAVFNDKKAILISSEHNKEDNITIGSFYLPLV